MLRACNCADSGSLILVLSRCHTMPDLHEFLIRRIRSEGVQLAAWDYVITRHRDMPPHVRELRGARSELAEFFRYPPCNRVCIWYSVNWWRLQGEGRHHMRSYTCESRTGVKCRLRFTRGGTVCYKYAPLFDD